MNNLPEFVSLWAIDCRKVSQGYLVVKDKGSL